MFKDKVLLITGGTGSFGNAVLERFINSDLKEIRIFSRDEKKQDDMRKKYHNDKIKFFIGDVRDYSTINKAMKGVDFVFHASALKQVPSCERFPFEAFKTNVIGTNNVLESAIENKVKKVIVLSTDKAVYPINAMGISKAMAEKIAIEKGMDQQDTIICRTRYGNVMASRGSVIPLFKQQIEEGQPLTITNGEMTRYMMTLDDAVELVLFAFKNGKQGDLFVQKAPSATINTLAKAMKEIMNSNVDIINIGTRAGEKMHETLVTKEEMTNAEDLDNYYRINNKSYEVNENVEEYNSHNTRRLDVEGMKELLYKTKLFGDYDE